MIRSIFVLSLIRFSNRFKIDMETLIEFLIKVSRTYRSVSVKLTSTRHISGDRSKATHTLPTAVIGKRISQLLSRV